MGILPILPTGQASCSSPHHTKARTSAPWALRIRASMSAIGSVMDMRPPSPSYARRAWGPSPARLGDTGDLAAVGQVPEAQAAHRELADVGARAAAPLAALVAPHLEP